MEEYNSNFSFNQAIPCTTGCELYIKTICSQNETNILSNLISFFELEDLVNLKLSCKSTYTSLNKHIIKNFVREGRITSKTRLKFWTANIDYTFVQKLVEKSISDISCFSDSLYEKINISYDKDVKNKRLSKNIIDFISVIHKDLTRTINSTNEKLNLEINNKLERVLIMTAYIRPEIGYCQGMNFVASALINFLNNEELSFWLFITLLDKFELNLLYSNVILFICLLNVF